MTSLCCTLWLHNNFSSNSPTFEQLCGFQYFPASSGAAAFGLLAVTSPWSLCSVRTSSRVSRGVRADVRAGAALPDQGSAWRPQGPGTRVTDRAPVPRAARTRRGKCLETPGEGDGTHEPCSLEMAQGQGGRSFSPGCVGGY